jgi:hypothetical protein
MHLNSRVAKHATVDEYVAAIPEPLREVAERAREVVDAELQEATSGRWSHPTWSIGKAPVCYLVMAHAKLREPSDVDRALFASWLRQARELELKAAGA